MDGGKFITMTDCIAGSAGLPGRGGGPGGRPGGGHGAPQPGLEPRPG